MLTVKSMEYEFTHGESSWRLDLYDLTAGEWIELEKHTGLDCGELMFKFVEGTNIQVKKAFYWMARVHDGEKIAFDSPVLEFTLRDFKAKLIKQEHGKQPDPEPGEGEEPGPTKETAKSSRSTKR